MKIITILLLTLGFAHAGQFQEQVAKIKKQASPKVFRSVLDKEPRQLTILLDAKHAVSYHTGKCHMSCAWSVTKGPLVDLLGAVYNGKHGPQPKRLGNKAFSNTAPEFSTAAGIVSFDSYSTKNGATSITYAVSSPKGKRLGTITETPSYQAGVLTRTISAQPAALAQTITFRSGSVSKSLEQPLSITVKF